MIKTIIAAISSNGVIGSENDIPWHYPADMKHFRDTTRGYPVIAGRKTYESFQIRPLPGRLNIVLSRNADYSAEGGAEVFTSLEAAYTRAEREAKDRVFILVELRYIDWPGSNRRDGVDPYTRGIDGDAFFRLGKGRSGMSRMPQRR